MLLPTFEHLDERALSVMFSNYANAYLNEKDMQKRAIFLEPNLKGTLRVLGGERRMGEYVFTLLDDEIVTSKVN